MLKYVKEGGGEVGVGEREREREKKSRRSERGKVRLLALLRPLLAAKAATVPRLLREGSSLLKMVLVLALCCCHSLPLARSCCSCAAAAAGCHCFCAARAWVTCKIDGAFATS